MPSRLALPLTLFLSSALSAAPCEPAHSNQCIEARTAGEFDNADAALNQLYRQLIERMSPPQPDPYVNFPELKSQFIEAQRQWLKFRDKECEAWYLINQAGTQRNIDHLVCLRDRTADRVHQLQQWRDNL
jgi:uncharacterized protein YecT (DUF1311 family)